MFPEITEEGRAWYTGSTSLQYVDLKGRREEDKAQRHRYSCFLAFSTYSLDILLEVTESTDHGLKLLKP